MVPVNDARVATTTAKNKNFIDVVIVDVKWTIVDWVSANLMCNTHVLLKNEHIVRAL